MKGTRMATLGLAIGLSLATGHGLAKEPAYQPTAAKTALPPAPTSPSVLRPSATRVLPAAVNPVVENAGPPALVELRPDAQAREERLLQAIAGNKPSLWEKLVPALIGLVGVLVGGAINVWSQRRQAASAEKAHRATAAFEAQDKIIDYRSRQAHEFYYPLLLMLQRSAGVRRQLCDHLAKKAPDRFRFTEESDGEHLFIYGPAAAEGIRFRLIESMHDLATNHVETLPMVKEIVAIGEKMSALIHDKGGLVLASHARLTNLLGGYLAHFSILREVAEKASQPEQLEGITYNVLYPTALDTELDKGIAFLQESIERWSKFSAGLWNEAMPGNPMPTMALPEPKSVPQPAIAR